MTCKINKMFYLIKYYINYNGVEVEIFLILIICGN